MAETLASYSVPEHHVKMYTANLQASIQKPGGILRPHVSQGSYRGERAQVVNFIGPIEFIERTTVYVDTKLSEMEHTSRWIYGAEFDAAVLIDRLDTLKMIYDPTNPYLMRMREGADRKIDELIMSKFFATAKTGKDGTTDTIFKAANIVVHNDTGMIVAKLRALRKLIKKRHVDLRMAKPLIAVTAEQIDDLLGEVAVGSSDYNAVKPLVNGEVSGFMGFTFIPYEDNGDVAGASIPTHVDGADTIRECPAWVPDGMHYGQWDALTVIISNRPDKNNIKQIHATFTGGATRLEEDKVYKVECVEPYIPA